uniref:Uncharacterized protein n=1 Tax=Arundo donax TaxID=35708 RepID=A0A0A8YYT7_ARUDO
MDYVDPKFFGIWNISNHAKWSPWEDFPL